jgi:hypothetical protein
MFQLLRHTRQEYSLRQRDVWNEIYFHTKFSSAYIACNSIEVYISGKLVTWTFVQIQNTHKIRIAAILGFECGENNVPKKYYICTEV